LLGAWLPGVHFVFGFALAGTVLTILGHLCIDT